MIKSVTRWWGKRVIRRRIHTGVMLCKDASLSAFRTLFQKLWRSVSRTWIIRSKLFRNLPGVRSTNCSRQLRDRVVVRPSVSLLCRSLSSSEAPNCSRSHDRPQSFAALIASFWCCHSLITRSSLTPWIAANWTKWKISSSRFHWCVCCRGQN